MRKSWFLKSLSYTFAAAAFTALVVTSHGQAQSLSKLTVYAQPSVNNDSLWMAFANNEYTKEGLDITYRLFPSGTTAFQSFNMGQGDIILSGDLPSVQYFFKADGAYRVFAVIERDATGYVSVARKDLKPTLERTLRWFEHSRAPERRTGVVIDDVEIPATD